MRICIMGDPAYMMIRMKYVVEYEFPGDEDPDYLDFAYFAFVIGMTFQVSDTNITFKKIRRNVLFHSLLSFVYNTIIVAISISIIINLI